MILDDQKTEDYTYQTEFSFQANRISHTRWLVYNFIIGLMLGAAMAILMFCVKEQYLSDPSRLVIALVIGIWPTKFIEKRAERSTKAAQLTMAVAFAIGMCIYVISLLN